MDTFLELPNTVYILHRRGRKCWRPRIGGSLLCVISLLTNVSDISPKDNFKKCFANVNTMDKKKGNNKAFTFEQEIFDYFGKSIPQYSAS